MSWRLALSLNFNKRVDDSEKTLAQKSREKSKKRALALLPAHRASLPLPISSLSMAGREDDAMLEDDAPPPGVERGAGGGEEAPPNFAGGGSGIDRPSIAAAPPPLSGSSAPLQSSTTPMSLDLPESSAAAVAKQAQALADARARQRATTVAVPADDGAVRSLLRSLGEPITLFGEREYERRDRARKLLARMDPGKAAEAVASVTEGGGVGAGGAALGGGPSPFFVPLRPEEAQTELFYTEGSEELRRAREKIALASLEAASRRLERERAVWEARKRRREAAAARVARAAAAAAAEEEAGKAKQNGGQTAEAEEEEPDPDAASDAVASSARAPSSLQLLCSELGDGRPLSALAFNHQPSSSSSSPSCSTIDLAVGSWSGCASVWRADVASGALLSASSSSKGRQEGGENNDTNGNNANNNDASASASAASSRSWWRAHDDRVTGVAWRPFPGGSSSDDSKGTRTRDIVVDLATASADGTARLWSSRACSLAAASAPSGAPCSPKPLAELKGHAARLARLAWHPGFQNGDRNGGSGSTFLATASFDGSWRLWDAERATSLVSAPISSPEEEQSAAVSPSCLLEQEGHSRAVYCLAWHPDGALLVSAGLDAHARVFDVRSGKTACVLSGHAKGILAVDVDPREGTTVATGAEDGCCRLWDLRARGRPLATLPAHSSLVSTCRFLRTSKSSSSSPSSSSSIEGRLLLTAGYDGEAKVWDASDGRLLKALRGHESRVMSSDIVALDSKNPCSSSSKSSKSAVPALLVATSAYDRTLKLWGRLE